jgi:hypothetical protein
MEVIEGLDKRANKVIDLVEEYVGTLVSPYASFFEETKMPYFLNFFLHTPTLLRSTRFKILPADFPLDTAATDGETVYFNEAFLNTIVSGEIDFKEISPQTENLTREQKKVFAGLHVFFGIIFHELMHEIFRHPEVAKGLGIDKPFDKKMFNVATDIYINELLDSERDFVRKTIKDKVAQYSGIKIANPYALPDFLIPTEFFIKRRKKSQEYDEEYWSAVPLIGGMDRTVLVELEGNGEIVESFSVIDTNEVELFGRVRKGMENLLQNQQQIEIEEITVYPDDKEDEKGKPVKNPNVKVKKLKVKGNLEIEEDGQDEQEKEDNGLEVESVEVEGQIKKKNKERKENGCLQKGSAGGVQGESQKDGQEKQNKQKENAGKDENEDGKAGEDLNGNADGNELDGNELNGQRRQNALSEQGNSGSKGGRNKAAENEQNAERNAPGRSGQNAESEREGQDNKADGRADRRNDGNVGNAGGAGGTGGEEGENDEKAKDSKPVFSSENETGGQENSKTQQTEKSAKDARELSQESGRTEKGKDSKNDKGVRVQRMKIGNREFIAIADVEDKIGEKESESLDENSRKKQGEFDRSFKKDRGRWEVIIDVIKNELSQKSKGSGIIDIAQLINTLYATTEKWKRLLDEFKNEIIKAQRKKTWTQLRKGREYYANKWKILFKGEKIKNKEGVSFYLVIDSSASISDHEYTMAKSLLISSLKEDVVKQVIEINHAEKIGDVLFYTKDGIYTGEIKNGIIKKSRERAPLESAHTRFVTGGTSHKEVFDVLERNVKKGDGVIFITDFESDVESLYNQYGFFKRGKVFWLITSPFRYDQALEYAGRIGKVAMLDSYVNVLKKLYAPNEVRKAFKNAKKLRV